LGIKGFNCNSSLLQLLRKRREEKRREEKGKEEKRESISF